MRLFSYKITRDYGFAPNPFYGVCTLATCKPQIRASANIGDIVVGCGSSANNLVGRVIFLLRVSGKSTFQEYWENPSFQMKKPFFKGSLRRAYGDNIYHRNNFGNWMQDKSHHSFPDGSLNTDNLDRDMSCNFVVWGTDFVYWGRKAPLIPPELRSFQGDDLYPNTRDRRSRFHHNFVEAVNSWFLTIPVRGYIGRPVNW